MRTLSIRRPGRSQPERQDAVKYHHPPVADRRLLHRPTGTGQSQPGIRRNEPGAPITVLPLAGGSLFVHRFGDRVVIVDGAGFTC